MICRFSFSTICIAFFAGCFWGHSVNDKEVALDEEDGVSGAHDVASLPPEIHFLASMISTTSTPPKQRLKMRLAQ